MDTTKNNGIVLATLIITMIILSIILSITFAITLKNPSLQQLLPGIRKRNIEKIYQEQLDARIQQEKFTGNEETDNNKVHQIITEIVQREHTIVGEIPKYTTGFEHDYTFTIQEKNKNVKTEITLKSKPELNSALQQVSIDSGYTTIPLPKVGDTVIYDPTKGVTDQSKLTYTSYKGTAQTGGNGSSTQTITAKSNQNEWIVLSTANNQVKVMAKNPIGDIEGGDNNKFTLIGGIGWLYAEEELHKMCSVYGYGKGAKQVVTTYQIGNYHVPGEAQTRTLIGSGARSMTMVDIVQIMKGDSYTDFTENEKKGFTSEYMDPSYKSLEVVYPTISSTQENGASTSKQRYENERYIIHRNEGYDKDLVEDAKLKANKRKLKEHIYKSSYWLGSRIVIANYNGASFSLFLGSYSRIRGSDSFFYDDGNTTGMYTSLRPVVYLDLNMVEKQSDGIWKIKD